MFEDKKQLFDNCVFINRKSYILFKELPKIFDRKLSYYHNFDD